MKTLHWYLNIDDENIAWLHFDMKNRSSNVLNEQSLDDLYQCLVYLHEKKPKGLVILSDKSSGFIAGADVHQFKGLRDKQEALTLISRGHKTFSKLESLTCPTLALIHGYCLGGGLELALACDYILVGDDEDTRLGLPEVKLGIHPGFGGTVRLIQRIGSPAALSLMLTGRNLSAHAAVRLGLADAKIPQRHEQNAAKRFLREQPTRRQAPWWDIVFKLGFIRKLYAYFVIKEIKRKARPEHYPAPYALLQLWKKHNANTQGMMEQEKNSVAELVTGDTAQNLIRLFELRERLKSFGKISNPRDIRHVHVVGAGVMGGDIAAWCALHGFRVTLQDAHHPAIAASMQRALILFKRKLKIPRLINAAMDRLIPDINADGVQHADIVIEAIFENLEAKQTLFKELECHVKADTLLVTNTSSLPLEDISSVLATPSRLVGLHFFNPVAQMPLLEIVHANNTDPDLQAQAAAFALKINKLPLPVKSGPGFLVNRVLMPYLLEAVKLVEEGIPAIAIDQAALDFGMPMGPIRLADQVGLDICLSVAEILDKALGFYVPERLRELVAAGKLGVKSNQGFYHYQHGKLQKPSAFKLASLPNDITDRLMYSLFNETVHCLQDGIVADADLIDAGIVFGTGFAPHLGGPMHYMNLHGSDRMAETMHDLEDKHGGRFHTDANWTQWRVTT